MSAEPTTSPTSPLPAPITANEQATIKRLLFQAVRENQGAVVEYMFRGYPDLQFSEADTNQTLLHAAVEANAVDSVRALLRVSHKVDVFNKNNETPLLLAVRKRAANIVHMLLRRDASVNEIDAQGNAALHEAVNTCQNDIARNLMLYGADVNIKNVEGLTPLFLAVRAKSLSLIDMLLERKADTNACDAPDIIRGCKQLLLPAARCNHRAALMFFLRVTNLSLTTDDTGRMLLHVASSQNAVATMRALIDAGANINDTSSVNGETPLMAAIRGNAVQAITFLLDKGVDVHIKDQDGDNALHLATMLGREVVVTALIDKGAKIDEKTKSGETSVFLAVRHRRAEVLDILLARMASANIANDNGISPILLALTSTYPTPPEMITALLQHGASSNIYRMLSSVNDADLADRLVSRFTISSLQVVTRYYRSLLSDGEHEDLFCQRCREHDLSKKRAREEFDDDEVVVVSTTLFCKICTTNSIEVTVAPCGHRGLCEECAQSLLGEPCPFCREPIVSFFRKEYLV